MNLFEKLNRLDDSLIESKRVVKKKKLTESVEDDKKKLFNAAASVRCKLDDDTIEYAMYDVDDFIENELVYCGKLLLSECPDMLFWRYVSDENFGSYCAVYESDEDFADAFYQISHDRVYDITDEVNGVYDYDDDIDEMLTENTRNNKLQSVAEQIVIYAEEHPESLKNFKYMYDYIDNLSQEGRFEIPAKVGQFVVEDPENVTEGEAEKFIYMLLDETDVGDKLIEVKRAAQRSAWNELRNRFLSI